MKKRMNSLLNKILKTPFDIEIQRLFAVSAIDILLGLSGMMRIELNRRILQALLYGGKNELKIGIIGFCGFQIICCILLHISRHIYVNTERCITKQIMRHIICKNANLKSWIKCEMNANERFTTAQGDCERYVSSLMSKAYLLSDFIIILCYIWYGCSINVFITGLITTLSLILSMLNRKNKENLYRYNEEFNKRYGRWSDFLWKAVDNLEIIKTFLNHKRIREENVRRNEEVNETNRKSLAAYLDVCLIEESSDILFTLGVLCYSFWAATKKIILLSDILAMVQALGQVQKLLFSLPEKVVEFQEISSVTSRISKFEMLMEEGDTKEIPSAFEKLDICDLSFSYQKEQVLTNINCTLEKGRFYILVGPSGSGKSTLLRAIMRLIPVEGKMWWNNQDFFRLNRGLLYQKMVYLAQNAVFLEDTIKNNICGQNPVDEKLYQDSLCKTYIDEMFKKNKIDDQTPLSFRGAPLSSGEGQMVLLANAIYGKGELILLDEAFSAIDPAKEKSFFELFLQLTQEGKTVVLVSHRLTNIELADQILFMEDGRICEMGSFDQLYRDCMKFRNWFDMNQEAVS